MFLGDAAQFVCVIVCVIVSGHVCVRVRVRVCLLAVMFLKMSVDLM